MINRGRGDIRRLAAASAISGSDDWAASTALALAVYAKTGPAVWLSASFLLTRIPSALVAPLSGIMADRLDRRRIMITCDLLGAVTYAGMAVTSAPLPLITLGAITFIATEGAAMAGLPLIHHFGVPGAVPRTTEP
jgi:MFS family permease